MKNGVKNGYREHPGKEILEKWSKNAFFPSGTLPKRWKMIIFRVYFCKSKVRVPFCITVIFLSFSVSILRKMETKWNGKWLKNNWKMDQKCQLWTSLLLVFWLNVVEFFWREARWPGPKTNLSSWCMDHTLFSNIFPQWPVRRIRGHYLLPVSLFTKLKFEIQVGSTWLHLSSAWVTVNLNVIVDSRTSHPTQAWPRTITTT